MTSSTPPSAKVTPPRKVHPPRKPFSNCPVPCGPAPPMPPIKQFCLLAWSTLKAPEPTSYFTRRGRTFTSEAQYFQMQARTIRPGRFPAPTPASHSAAGPAPLSAESMGQAQPPENRLKLIVLFIHFQLLRWGQKSYKFTPPRKKTDPTRRIHIYIYIYV